MRFIRKLAGIHLNSETFRFDGLNDAVNNFFDFRLIQQSWFTRQLRRSRKEKSILKSKLIRTSLIRVCDAFVALRQKKPWSDMSSPNQIQRLLNMGSFLASILAFGLTERVVGFLGSEETSKVPKSGYCVRTGRLAQMKSSHCMLPNIASASFRRSGGP
jgi:hypothetical protein